MHNELTLTNDYYYIELYIYHCFSQKCIPLFPQNVSMEELYTHGIEQ